MICVHDFCICADTSVKSKEMTESQNIFLLYPKIPPVPVVSTGGPIWIN